MRYLLFWMLVCTACGDERESTPADADASDGGYFCQTGDGDDTPRFMFIRALREVREGRVWLWPIKTVDDDSDAGTPPLVDTVCIGI